MASTHLTFATRAEHRAWLATQAALPRGFRVGTSAFTFTPVEAAPKTARMTLTLIALAQPTADFAAVFTRNAFPGAPVIIGRRRLDQPTLGAILVNNKISNVGAADGVAIAERIASTAALALGQGSTDVLPASTGIIGWRLPATEMVAAVPAAVSNLSGDSVLPAAEGIMTTDLYPKIRRAPIGAGSIVGIAKGAGMIEPSLATMLVFLLTDLAVPREDLRALLSPIVDRTFNRISIDTDTSTSDTVALLSSGAVPCPDRSAFAQGLETVCADLAEDVVRNGEGVHHVLAVTVRNAPSETQARAIGKAIVNSPLVKTAVCGNDPNVGRILAAIGKEVGRRDAFDLSRLSLRMGGHDLFKDGAFRLSPETEAHLVAYLRQGELYASHASEDGIFRPPVDFPRHEKRIELDVDLGVGTAVSSVLGADLSHEYVSENADYRS